MAPFFAFFEKSPQTSCIYSDFIAVLPQGLKYEDFVFAAENGGYVPKEGTGIDPSLVIGFADGQLAFIMTKGSLDPNDPTYNDVIVFEIVEVGNATIEIPDYIIAEE